MFGLGFNALRARRPQALALFALTVLAALGASAAPWFLAWAKDAVAEASIAAAPAEQRVLTASGSVRYDLQGVGLPTQVLRERVEPQLVIPGATPVAGARIYVNMVPVDGTPGAASGLYLAYRDDICAQLRVDGHCPEADSEVMIGRSAADALGVGVGDDVVFSGFRLPEPARFTVSGVYEVDDVLGPYWAGTDLLAGSANLFSALGADPAFVGERALLATRPDGLDMDLHLVLPPAVYHPGEFDLAGALNEAAADLRSISFDLETQARRLADQVRRDQRLVEIGITVAATQLVVLCWFALFLAVRHTSEERRPDIGLLKLRGVANWRVWALTAQQTTLPMVAGCLLGWGLGFLAAGVLAGDVGGLAGTVDTDPARTLRLSLLAATGAGVGALAAAVVAEWRAVRSSVIGLLRRVPERHRGWRAEVLDLVVVLVAAVGVYQGHVEVTSGGASTLALVAPALVGLAVALLVARVLPWLAAAVGGVALGSGRVGLALAALHVARRPGAHRVFAVLAVAMSVLATSLVFWNAATHTWAQRATQVVGADRVLTVRADNSAALLAAVRAVDPDGMFAMAAARTFGPTSEDRVLAVDSARFAAVAAVAPEYGLDLAGLVERLRPPAPVTVSVTDGPITLDLRGPADLGPDLPLSLRLNLTTGLGEGRPVEVGPLTPDRRSYEATVSGCPQGCRLVSLEIRAPARISRGLGGTVEVFGLAQADGPLVPPQVLGDVTRWRPQVGAVGIGPLLRASDGALRLSLYDGSVPANQQIDPRLFIVDAPTPLPVLLAGERPRARRSGDTRVTVLGTERVPFEVVATAGVLPRLGDVGVVADLEYAQRLVGRAGEAAALEVWLTADAPPGIVADLESHGVQLMREETADAAYAGLAAQGPGVALRFQLFAAGVILLLAAGTLVVTAAVERRPRVAELAWMRAQGLGVRPMRVAAYAGGTAMVGGGIITGLAAAMVAAVVVTASMPVFADDWALLPPPAGPQPVPVLLALLAGTVVLGGAALLGANRVADGADGADRGRPAEEFVG